MIYLLPGMGATSAMYEGPWKRLDNSRAIEWPRCVNAITIDDVANAVLSEHEIGSSDSIVGSSLGGIVALEIHRKVNLQHVFLLGSAMAREEINHFLIALSPIARVTPVRFIQYLAGKGSTLLSSMFTDVDADFIRAMCMAVSQWDGYKNGVEAITRIHGEQDTIIRCPKDVCIIPGAGHLIAMTHAENCIRVIEQVVQAPG